VTAAPTQPPSPTPEPPGLESVKAPRLAVSAASLVYTPAADARVEAASPNTNFGSATTFIADTSPTIHSYLRFAVSGLSGPAQSAKLRLWVVDGTSNGPPISTCASTNWGETTITWNNKPATSNPRDDKGAIATGTWIEYDVAPFIVGDGSYCFALVPQSSNGVDFASKESANPPQLVIDSGAGTTPTATPTVPPVTNVTFPARAAFYYPWFPGAWTQGGMYPYTQYEPSLGYYDLDSTDINAQIAAMQYGKIQVGIASWWGQGSREDGKIPTMLSQANGTGFKWAIITSSKDSVIPQLPSSPRISTIWPRIAAQAPAPPR
jgi:hypothetical protein